MVWGMLRAGVRNLYPTTRQNHYESKGITSVGGA